MKWIDLPPAWLVLFLAIAWAQARYLPTPFPEVLGNDIGALAIFCGVFLMAAAAMRFRRHRTTIVPHRNASALITGGIYAKSRNPIYLADLLFLAGFSLWWGSVLGLVLVPVLAAVLRQRFILPEEARLRADFGAGFEKYFAETRRWL